MLMPQDELIFERKELLECQKRIDRPAPCDCPTPYGTLFETLISGVALGVLAMAVKK